MDEMADAKKYLEEVMGIVEDEKFNQERRLKRLKELKQKQRDKEGRGKRNIASRHDDLHPGAECQDEPSSCVKVVVDEWQTNRSDITDMSRDDDNDDNDDVVAAYVCQQPPGVPGHGAGGGLGLSERGCSPSPENPQR